MAWPSLSIAWFDARAAPHSSTSDIPPIPGISRSIMYRLSWPNLASSCIIL
jgi:hypothetical protein